MKTRFMFKALAIVFILLLVISCSKEPKFDHYGVYIKDNNDFKEIKGYDWSGMYDIYSNLRNFDKSQILFEDELEIYVYSPKAKITDYKLIEPLEKTSNGNFISANFEYGRKSPEVEFYSEVEITVEPIDKKDDMVIIRSKPIGGTYILHIIEDSKGKDYVFNSQNKANVNKKETKQILSSKKIKIYTKEIKKTINNWINLLNKSKYIEFAEQFFSPFQFESMKEYGEFDDPYDDPKQEAEEINEIISELKKMLQEKPIINQDYVSYNNSWVKLCKINSQWYKWYPDLEENEQTSKPVEEIK